MATLRGFRMGRWLAGRLMKELGLVSCQQPTHFLDLFAETGRLGNVILTGQQANHQSAGNGVGNPR